MYESAGVLTTWNLAFQELLRYYRYWTKNPLEEIRIKMAVAYRAIRVCYVVVQTGCDFYEEKFQMDIIRLEVV